jgi:hypothetical protein
MRMRVHVTRVYEMDVDAQTTDKARDGIVALGVANVEQTGMLIESRIAAVFQADEESDGDDTEEDESDDEWEDDDHDPGYDEDDEDEDEDEDEFDEDEEDDVSDCLAHAASDGESDDDDE